MSKQQQLLIPGSYKLESAILTNYKGEEIDIRSLITEFTINESFHSMFCLYEFVIFKCVDHWVFQTATAPDHR